MNKESLPFNLRDGRTTKIHWDPWDQKYMFHVFYNYDNNMMCDSVIGVNAIANQVAEQFKKPQYDYTLHLENSILTVSIWKHY